MDVGSGQPQVVPRRSCSSVTIPIDREKWPKRLFEDYTGTLQVDGYSAYNVLEKNKDLVRIGCNMHGRRKVFCRMENRFKERTVSCDNCLGVLQTDLPN